MAKLKLLVAALCTTVVISAPAMAREHHVRHRVVVSEPAPGAIYLDGRACIPAPRIGSFATAPWGNGNIPCEPYGYGYYAYDGGDAWNY
jgi:hypothetical protein